MDRRYIPTSIVSSNSVFLKSRVSPRCTERAMIQPTTYTPIAPRILIPHATMISWA